MARLKIGSNIQFEAKLPEVKTTSENEPVVEATKEVDLVDYEVLIKEAVERFYPKKEREEISLIDVQDEVTKIQQTFNPKFDELNEQIKTLKVDFDQVNKKINTVQEEVNKQSLIPKVTNVSHIKDVSKDVVAELHQYVGSGFNILEDKFEHKLFLMNTELLDQKKFNKFLMCLVVISIILHLF